MKRISRVVFGLVVMVGLLFGSVDFAAAVLYTPEYAPEVVLSGATVTSVDGDLITASARKLLYLEGYDAGGHYIDSAEIAGGILAFDNGTNRLTFTGSIDGSPFTIIGNLSNYSGPSSNRYYYSWNVFFPDLSGLSNGLFTVGTLYAGAISITQAGDSLTGRSSVTGDFSQVPIPASAWLLGSGLIGLVAVRRRLKGKR